VGDTGNVGNHEILTVRSVDISNNRLTFRSPVLKLYGASNSNATLTGQKIVVQRIPHYGNVTVSGTLTANAWDGATGGLLFIKARGTMFVTSTGVVTMFEKGYRSLGGGPQNSSVGESYPGIGARASTCTNNGGGGPGGNGSNCYYGSGGSYGTPGKQGQAASGSVVAFTYGDALLTRWFMGSAGGNYTSYPPSIAGGIVVIWADTLGVVGRIRADGGSSLDYTGGSAGGSVYLRSNTMNIGQNRVTAQGGISGIGGTTYGTGGAGRIRVDAKSLSTGNTTSPAFTLGTAASSSVRVQTSALDNVSGAITRARVASALQDTRGGTISYELSSNGGGNWKAFTPGDPLQSFDVPGSDLRLRLTLTENGSNQPLSVQGLAVEYVAP